MVKLNDVLIGGVSDNVAKESWNGILFWLNSKSRKRAKYRMDCWEIEISNSNFIIARTKATLSNAELRTQGYNICERALDLFSADGCGNHYVIAPFEKPIMVTAREGHTELWLYCEEDFTLFAEASLSVMYADGSEIRQLPRKQTTEANAYTYYRYSKLSNNIYDEYRWMYMVFESLMQAIAPQYVAQNKGGQNEKEGKWIKRALKEADKRYKWISAMKWSTTNPINHFYEKQYKGVRCNLFHAKQGWLLPNDQNSLDIVSKRLNELAELCEYLLRHVFSLRKEGGWLTPLGFKNMIGPLFEKATAFFSEENIVSLGNDLTIDDMPPVLELAEVKEKAIIEDRVRIHVYYSEISHDMTYQIKSCGLKDDDCLAICSHLCGHTLSFSNVNSVYMVEMIKLVNWSQKKSHRQNGVITEHQISI